MERPRPSPGRLAAVLIVALMALGSIVLWIGIPLFWVWVASRLSASSQPTLGPYVLILVAIPVSMFLLGRMLARLNGVYGSITGRAPTMRVALPWMRSMRGERSSPRPATVLDIVMVSSVLVALLTIAVWFFAFAGSSLPS